MRRDWCRPAERALPNSELEQRLREQKSKSSQHGFCTRSLVPNGQTRCKHSISGNGFRSTFCAGLIIRVWHMLSRCAFCFANLGSWTLLGKRLASIESRKARASASSMKWRVVCGHLVNCWIRDASTARMMRKLAAHLSRQTRRPVSTVTTENCFPSESFKR